MKFQSIIPQNKKIPYRLSIIKPENITGFETCWHDTYELFYCIKGKAKIQIEGKVIALEKGEIAAVNPYEYHLLIDLTGDILSLSFPLFFLKNVGIEKLEYQINQVIDTKETANRDLNTYFSSIYEDVTTTQELPIRTKLVGLGYVILGELFSKYAKKMNIIQLNSLSTRFDYVKSALDFIQDNYFQNISIQSLANHLNISPSYFSHIFKEITGETPLNNIEKVRVAHAKQLILASDLEMWKIANKVGFSDLKAMNKAFKKHYETTAYQWKKTKRKAGYDLF